MKKSLLLITLILGFCSCLSQTRKGTNKPYETTWLEITKVDSGYVVYNYPHLLNDGETKSPNIIKVKDNNLTWITFSDEPISYKLNDINCLSDTTYMFKVGNFFKFDYINKINHIAKWSIYHGDDRLMSDYLYVDSLYNSFPIIDFDWGQERPIDDEAN